MSDVTCSNCSAELTFTENGSTVVVRHHDETAGVEISTTFNKRGIELEVGCSNCGHVAVTMPPRGTTGAEFIDPAQEASA